MNQFYYTANNDGVSNNNNSNQQDSIVIIGGNDGPLYRERKNPNYARNMRNLVGEICPACGKGILLLDNKCVQDGYGFLFMQLSICCPCLICVFMEQKRKCTSCGELFPNTCC